MSEVREGARKEVNAVANAVGNRGLVDAFRTAWREGPSLRETARDTVDSLRRLAKGPRGRGSSQKGRRSSAR